MTQVPEGFAVDLSHSVLMEEEPVQVDQPSEDIFRQDSDSVAVEEEVSEIHQV